MKLILIKSQILCGFCILLFIAGHQAEAQTKGIYPYKCFITLKGRKLQRVYLYQITDSTIQIARKHNHLFKADSLPVLIESIPINQDLVKIRARSRFSGLIGGGIGFVVGVALATLAIEGSSPDIGEALVGVFLVIPLAGTGSGFLGAYAANSTSKVEYKHLISDKKEFERLKYYSFKSWVERR
ncbi:hypothetical protein [Dyadobacter helix]|nr:hypothetical protein [Dyadobacter sp. CECT 9275]